MKNLKFIKLFLILIGLSVSQAQAFLTQEETDMTKSHFLTQREIKDAEDLATSTVKLENFTPAAGTEGWLTIEAFPFEYKGNPQTFWIANTFNTNSKFGELTIYKNCIEANNEKRNLKFCPPGGPHCISTFFGQDSLSCLNYQYNPGERPYFILELVQTTVDGRGYSQACVKYFLDTFVSEKTGVTHVFSDCRALATQHYFPKYGFVKGMLEGYTLEKGMRFPYHWIKKEATDTTQ